MEKINLLLITRFFKDANAQLFIFERNAFKFLAMKKLFNRDIPKQLAFDFTLATYPWHPKITKNFSC